MRIYKSEKEAGIDLNIDKIGNSSFVISKLRVEDIKKYFDNLSISEITKATNTVQSVEQLLGQDQPDLALVVSILVSTGWNLNDEIFTPSELWKARYSPMHKPINDNHDTSKIMGHIVQSRVLDKSGEEIVLENEDAIPTSSSEFDIEVAGVLYRQFPSLTERIDEILSKANSGEMFVSMEAWFPDFGYGFIDPSTGETKLIDRDESTAFLTKHLRVYGGSGRYQDYRIGRVLKNIIFGAQGFVDNPANPESVIKVAANKRNKSNIFVNAELNDILEGGVDSVTEKEIKELQKSLEEVKACLKTKEEEVSVLQDTVKNFKDKNYEGQITALAGQVEELTTNAKDVSSKVDTIEAEKVKLCGELKDANDRVEKTQAELDEIHEIEISRSRLDKLSKVKKVEDEEVTLAELRKMTDETFEIVLKYAGDKEVSNDDNNSKADKNQKDESDGDTAKGSLDNVEVENSAEFNVIEDNADSEAEIWLTTAQALFGYEKGKNEGGE